jgi:hypothetical protein
MKELTMPDRFWDDARRQLLAELQEDGTTAPDSFSKHELLDRAHLASAFFDAHVLNHPACVLSDELWQQATAVAEALGDFYQKVGEVTGRETDTDAVR